MNKFSPSAHVSPGCVPMGGMVDDRLRDLHKKHGAFVLRFLSWCCGIPGRDVKDVAQLVWLQVHRLGPAPFRSRPWITKLAKNVAANERRKASRRPDPPSDGVPVDLLAPGLTAEELLALRAYLSEMVANLSPEQREALFLATEGITAEGIGEIQGITAENARQRVHEARKRLRQAEGARFMPIFAVGLEDFIRPLPPEELERQWNNIESAIRQQETPGEHEQPPSSSLPPPPAVVPLIPVPPGLFPVVAPKVAPALIGALLGAAAALWFMVPTPATCRDLPLMEKPSSLQPADAVSAPRSGVIASQTAPNAAPSMRGAPAKRAPAKPLQDLDLRARSRRWSEDRP